MLTEKQVTKIMNGDLLFIKDHTGMGRAVAEATGQETHVAILEIEAGQILVIEAHPKLGVVQRPLPALLADLQKDYPRPADLLTVKRLNSPIDLVAALNRAKAAIGKPYNHSFIPQSGGFYCSELVYEFYLDNNGRHIFKASPMNWRDKDGLIPLYWLKHFAKLGIPVPEGVLGTNPSDLSADQKLEVIEVDWSKIDY